VHQRAPQSGDLDRASYRFDRHGVTDPSRHPGAA
jgi:hypothetical protein